MVFVSFKHQCKLGKRKSSYIIEILDSILVFVQSNNHCMDWIAVQILQLHSYCVVTGEKQKRCRVYIVNDNTFEPNPEVFRLVLGNPESQAAGLAKIGGMNSTLVRINDDSDSKILVLSIAFQHFEQYIKNEITNNAHSNILFLN